uniref:C2H2-type domain-containing protein n=1 Tax=viral metagenome TaxID=1070528 RepID=A0A6C0C2P0_9ZZZZ
MSKSEISEIVFSEENEFFPYAVLWFSYRFVLNCLFAYYLFVMIQSAFFLSIVFRNMLTKKMPKNANVFYCETCNFKCSKQSNFDKHNSTAKHRLLTSVDRNVKKSVFACKCGKEYKSRQGLQQHKKKCNIIHNESTNNNQQHHNRLNDLMKQNEILQEFIIEHKKEREEHKKEREEHKKEIEKLSEQISKISRVTNNKTTNNNNKFNLNFFLNTQCKDAMSIQSFMENLKLGCKELEHMGDVGYLNGMIDIFNNTIGNMDVYKRPLHCTDLKREVLYFKQGNDWERDSEDKQHLKKLIKNVESKNYDNLQEWQKDHPGSLQCDSRDSEHYMKIATEALGGADSNKDSIYLTKIMKHIVREVHVKP